MTHILKKHIVNFIIKVEKVTRVLEVIYGFGYGGIRAFLMNYLQHIDKDKFKIDIYVFGYDSSPFTDKVKEMGVGIYFQPENNVRNIPHFVSQLKTFMDEHGPYDVVHANNNLISAWVLLAAKLAKVPIRLSHSHATEHYGNSLAQRMYAHMRRLMIEVLATKKLACGQLAGEAMYKSKTGFEIISNGIAIDRFIDINEAKVDKLRKQLNIPIGAKVYANVSRMDSGKNHIFALQVFKEIKKREPNAVFLYGGVNPKIDSTLEYIKSKVIELKLEDSCIYTDPIMEVEILYHLTDVWIYCSLNEGLPFGPIELQAASIPLIASDVITTEIDLGLGLVHFLPLTDSFEKWADLAISLEKRIIPKEVITEAFRKHNFDITKNVKKLETIYDDTFEN